MTFEDRLLDQLRHVVAENPAPAPAKPRVGRRRLALSGAGLTTAAAAAVVLLTSGGVSPERAYAVDEQSNGSVSVTINDLRDAEGLQRKLRAAGVPADVRYVAHPQVCAPGQGPGMPTQVYEGSDPARKLDDAPAPGKGDHLIEMSSVVESSGKATFTISPGELGAGERLTITASVGDLNSLAMGISSKGHPLPAPPCLPAGAPPTK
ncbi:MAG: hypothetical protein QOF76_3231 [Solirubrobacteraceae bacterium]|jgi:hypothetical protein|nr:hypothetical protein [Solirubrobacteraceae bacterium]